MLSKWEDVDGRTWCQLPDGLRVCIIRRGTVRVHIRVDENIHYVSLNIRAVRQNWP